MRKNIKLSISLVAVLWLVWGINILLPIIDLNNFGIIPRNSHGLAGIVCAPFLHGNFAHLLSNSAPLLILLLTLFTFYTKTALKIILYSTVLGGALVWLMGRSTSVHIGASGLIYGLAAFLITSGILRKDFKSLLIAIMVFLMYGGLIWGVFPSKPWISWEGHFFGMVSGIVLAYYYRRAKVV